MLVWLHLLHCLCLSADDHNRVIMMGETDEDAYINGSYINVSITVRARVCVYCVHACVHVCICKQCV